MLPDGGERRGQARAPHDHRGVREVVGDEPPAALAQIGNALADSVLCHAKPATRFEQMVETEHVGQRAAKAVDVKKLGRLVELTPFEQRFGQCEQDERDHADGQTR